MASGDNPFHRGILGGITAPPPTWKSESLSEEPVAGFLDLVRRLDASVSPDSKRSLQRLVSFYANDEEGSVRGQLDRMAAERPMSEALAALGRGSRMIGQALEAEGDADAAAAWGQIDAAMGSTYEELRALGGEDAAVAEMDYEAAIADVDEARLQRQTGLDESVMDAVMRPVPGGPARGGGNREESWRSLYGGLERPGRPGTEMLPETDLGEVAPSPRQEALALSGVVSDRAGTVAGAGRGLRTDPGAAPGLDTLLSGYAPPGQAGGPAFGFGPAAGALPERPPNAGVFAGGDIDDILGKPRQPKELTAEQQAKEDASILGLLGAEGDLGALAGEADAWLAALEADETGAVIGGAGAAAKGGAGSASPGGAAAPGSPAAPAQPEGGGMSPMSLGGALIGGAGIAAAIGNTIADFRTTAALEDQLASSAAGDTIARREGALAGSQAQRNIMATSMGRRDISPALALRNAQMAGSRTLSDVYGQAAIASARERRESEAKLAQLRKQRWNTLFGGLTRTAGDVGALLATQGAAEETSKMNKRLTDLEASNLNQVGLAPGQRRR
jgi:hypothetical protein